MPIYEYQCQKCDYKFEELVRGDREIKCPKCKSSDIKKLLSSFSTLKKSGISSDSNSCPTGTCNLS